jgi:hypothetical protein
MKLNRLAALLLGAGALLSFSSSVAADIKAFSVPMSGAQEVPPSGSAGTGTCTVTLDDVTGAVTVSGSYAGLTGTATAAHIHGPASAGVNAGVIISLTASGGTSGTITGGGTLSAGNITNMVSGLTYLNLHTTSSPGGELRGQITTTVPSMPEVMVAVMALLALGGGAFVLSRRG